MRGGIPRHRCCCETWFLRQWFQRALCAPLRWRDPVAEAKTEPTPRACDGDDTSESEILLSWEHGVDKPSLAVVAGKNLYQWLGQFVWMQTCDKRPQFFAPPSFSYTCEVEICRHWCEKLRVWSPRIGKWVHQPSGHQTTCHQCWGSKWWNLSLGIRFKLVVITSIRFFLWCVKGNLQDLVIPFPVQQLSENLLSNLAETGSGKLRRRPLSIDYNHGDFWDQRRLNLTCTFPNRRTLAPRGPSSYTTGIKNLCSRAFGYQEV